MLRSVAVAVAVAACCAASARAQQATTGTPQSLFTHEIATDPKTSADVRGALRAKRVFVDEDITFADLTGDGRQDAIVRVDSGGVGGAIAVYVFSTEGGQKLHAVYRSQHLYRALVAVDGTSLLLSTPRYATGDEVCCPATVLERALTWSARGERLVLRSTRTAPAPV